MIAQWNLARLAEALLPLLGSDQGRAVSTATDLLHQFPERYEAYRVELVSLKLGLSSREMARILDRELQALMVAERADFTASYYSLGAALTGDARKFLDLFPNAAERAALWLDRYRDEIGRERAEPSGSPDPVGPVNPLYIPRNLQVEHVLEAAEAGDIAPFFRLLGALQAPYEEREELADLATPPGAEQWTHVTFCGT
jgi:uncharacterized protein YdiU (UPF0061 family)